METPLRKSVTAAFKALKSPGEFEAEFSVFGNVDFDGDRLLKGAFEPAFEANPNPAIVWTHMWEIPPIGETIDAVETETGAKGTGRLFLDDHEIAGQVWAGLKSGALTQYSFAYNVAEARLVDAAGAETPRKDGRIQELVKLSHIYEWGPTLVGANSATSTLDLAKSMRLRLGAKMLGRRDGSKGYDDADYWGISPLLDMLDDAFWFIYCEDDAEDIATMRGIASMLLTLLGKEATEDDAAKSKLIDWLKSETARKAGARHSAEDYSRIQAIHDLAVDLGASTATVGTADDVDDGGDPLIMSLSMDERLGIGAVRPVGSLQSDS